MFVNVFHMCLLNMLVPKPLAKGRGVSKSSAWNAWTARTENCPIFIDSMKYTSSCYVISMFSTEPVEPPETHMNHVKRIDEPFEIHRCVSWCVYRRPRFTVDLARETQ